MSSDEVLGADPQVVSAEAGAVVVVAESVANEPELTAGPETPEPEINPTMAELNEAAIVAAQLSMPLMERGDRERLLHRLGKWRGRSNSGMIRRVDRAARRYLKAQVETGNTEAAAILADESMFDAFVDKCACDCLTDCGVLIAEGERAGEFAVGSDSMVGGPIGDALAKLIDSFMQDPEKWIRVITLIISMFA